MERYLHSSIILEVMTVALTHFNLTSVLNIKLLLCNNFVGKEM